MKKRGDPREASPQEIYRISRGIGARLSHMHARRRQLIGNERVRRFAAALRRAEQRRSAIDLELNLSTDEVTTETGESRSRHVDAETRRSVSGEDAVLSGADA